MGTAFGVCFGYWIGGSALFYSVSFMCNTHLTFLQILSLSVSMSKAIKIQSIYLFINDQLFWTQACPEGMCTNGTQFPCEVPSLLNPTTRKGWPHHRSLRPLLFSNSDMGSFIFHKNKSVKVL